MKDLDEKINDRLRSLTNRLTDTISSDTKILKINVPVGELFPHDEIRIMREDYCTIQKDCPVTVGACKECQHFIKPDLHDCFVRGSALVFNDFRLLTSNIKRIIAGRKRDRQDLLDLLEFLGIKDDSSEV